MDVASGSGVTKDVASGSVVADIDVADVESMLGAVVNDVVISLDALSVVDSLAEFSREAERFDAAKTSSSYRNDVLGLIGDDAMSSLYNDDDADVLPDGATIASCIGLTDVSDDDDDEPTVGLNETCDIISQVLHDVTAEVSLILDGETPETAQRTLNGTLSSHETIPDEFSETPDKDYENLLVRQNRLLQAQLESLRAFAHNDTTCADLYSRVVELERENAELKMRLDRAAPRKAVPKKKKVVPPKRKRGRPPSLLKRVLERAEQQENEELATASRESIGLAFPRKEYAKKEKAKARLVPRQTELLLDDAGVTVEDLRDEDGGREHTRYGLRNRPKRTLGRRQHNYKAQRSQDDPLYSVELDDDSPIDSDFVAPSGDSEAEDLADGDGEFALPRKKEHVPKSLHRLEPGELSTADPVAAAIVDAQLNGDAALSSEEHVPCFHCGEIFASSVAMKEHITAHHSSRYVCEHCDKPFSHQSFLQLHLFKTHNEGDADEFENPREYPCPLCSQRFSYRNILASHLKTHSRILNLYECDKCRLRFDSAKSVALHRKSVHNIKKRGPGDRVCEVCRQRGFETLAEYREHMQLHQEKKDYMCELCGNTFGRKRYLTKHVQMWHLKEKRYKCDQCDLAFVKWDKLNDHKKSHSSERPYLCAECGKSFKRRDTLRQHQRFTHENEPLPESYRQRTAARQLQRLMRKEERERELLVQREETQRGLIARLQDPAITEEHRREILREMSELEKTPFVQPPRKRARKVQPQVESQRSSNVSTPTLATGVQLQATQLLPATDQNNALSAYTLFPTHPAPDVRTQDYFERQAQQPRASPAHQPATPGRHTQAKYAAQMQQMQLQSPAKTQRHYQMMTQMQQHPRPPVVSTQPQTTSAQAIPQQHQQQHPAPFNPSVLLPQSWTTPGISFVFDQAQHHQFFNL